MGEPLGSVGAITMFVADRERAKSFYRSAFGLEPLFEDEHSVVFGLQNLVVNLLVESEAPELIEPALVAPPGSGARFQVTIGVEDTDAACAELARRGVELLNGPVDRPWGVRTAAFADPDGHVWEVAARISA